MVANVSTIQKYFPDLTAQQIDRFTQLEDIYTTLNQKINVISRKDIDELYIRHVLHSLSIAKFVQFRPESYVLDVGTGGGFPGIPLAIIFPETRFFMIDGRRKKISVVSEVIESLGLDNALAKAQRSEELKAEFDFITARAVTSLDKLIPQTFHLLSKTQTNALPNGLIALKGGNLDEEIKSVANNHRVERVDICDYFEEAFFETKQILYVQG